MSQVRTAIGMAIALRDSEDHFEGDIDSVVANSALKPWGS